MAYQQCGSRLLTTLGLAAAGLLAAACTNPAGPAGTDAAMPISSTHAATAGSGTPVVLSWYCWNSIIVSTGGATDWWGGGSPAPTGPLESAPVPNDGNHRHEATGTLTVAGDGTTRFRADAGGELTLQPVAPDVVLEASCRLGPV
jgi:hypothetical protein